MGDARISLLQRMPVFGGICEDILKFLLELSPLVSVPQSQFFFHQGDRADSMFVLERGKVAILKTWQGREYLLQHRHAGDCFGEIALIDLCPRSASVLAVEGCAAIEVSSTTLYRIYEKDLEQLALIYMNMGREVSRRLREADERLFQAKVEAVLIGEDYTFKSV
jgi:CRP/FNR family transcriptional regulator, cyclic AMP receptor protein